MSEHEPLPEWERLLAAERHLQALLPGAVLVGGTAAAMHGGHRVSLDGDHVLEDLRTRFDIPTFPPTTSRPDEREGHGVRLQSE